VGEEKKQSNKPKTKNQKKVKSIYQSIATTRLHSPKKASKIT
jgi:hypothetical protein